MVPRAPLAENEKAIPMSVARKGFSSPLQGRGQLKCPIIPADQARESARADTGLVKMSKRVDDAGALFRTFWSGSSEFREFTRDADADLAENKWPLMKSMAPDQRVMPPPLSAQQKQGWLEQSPLSQVFGRIEGGTRIRDKARSRG